MKNTPPSETSIAIQVDAATGKPSAKPDSAWVSPSGTIVWTSAEPFEIILKLLWANERVLKKSVKAGDKHELKVMAGAINGRYSYGIKVGDQEVDPDVIIGPKSQNQ
ncbi:hypothetical protein GCM10027431_30030 [Lysobacter rhizosphaerae]